MRRFTMQKGNKSMKIFALILTFLAASLVPAHAEDSITILKQEMFKRAEALFDSADIVNQGDPEEFHTLRKKVKDHCIRNADNVGINEAGQLASHVRLNCMDGDKIAIQYNIWGTVIAYEMAPPMKGCNQAKKIIRPGLQPFEFEQTCGMDNDYQRGNITYRIQMTMDW